MDGHRTTPRPAAYIPRHTHDVSSHARQPEEAQFLRDTLPDQGLGRCARVPSTLSV